MIVLAFQLNIGAFLVLSQAYPSLITAFLFLIEGILIVIDMSKMYYHQDSIHLRRVNEHLIPYLYLYQSQLSSSKSENSTINRVRSIVNNDVNLYCMRGFLFFF